MREVVPGLAAVAERYDAYVLDQWGVMHDGRRPYEGAVEAMQRLREARKRVVILSNSGQRSAPNEAALERLGFGRSLWDDLVSAGEDAWRALKADPPGRRWLVFGDPQRLAGLDFTPVEKVEEAECLVALRMDEPELTGYDAIFAKALARGLLLVCANPDHWRFADGVLLPAPGTFAERYAAMGGRVQWHGKPHAHIYETALASLGVSRGRVLCVGDSMHHDVRGGRDAGLATALVTAGIHRDVLGEPPDPVALGRLEAEAGAVPDYILSAFRW
jgi:HAD superfamily hydrolase (TIGR01459 family)